MSIEGIEVSTAPVVLPDEFQTEKEEVQVTYTSPEAQNSVLREAVTNLNTELENLTVRLSDVRSTVQIQQETINGLTNRLQAETARTATLSELLDEARTNLQTRVRYHEQDIALIGETLIERATQHEWCHVYDSAVNEINEKLHIQLPDRIKEFTITGRVSFTFTQAAEFNHGAGDYEAREYLRQLSYGDLNIDTYSFEIDEFEIEEA